jgi:hypothetical protein
MYKYSSKKYTSKKGKKNNKDNKNKNKKSKKNKQKLYMKGGGVLTPSVASNVNTSISNITASLNKGLGNMSTTAQKMVSSTA